MKLLIEVQRFLLDHAVVRGDRDPGDALHDAGGANLGLRLAHVRRPAVSDMIGCMMMCSRGHACVMRGGECPSLQDAPT